MTELEIIDETVEYYSKHPRAVKENNYCTYLDEEGNKCAVGRCIDPELFEEFNEYLVDLFEESFETYYLKSKDPKSEVLWRISVENIKNLDKFLLKPYKGKDSHFWSRLQTLHDLDSYWREDGLSKEGEFYVRRLKSYYE